jgi:hypothetical protein
MLPAVTINIHAIDDRCMRSVEVINVLTVKPGYYSAI